MPELCSGVYVGLGTSADATPGTAATATTAARMVRILRTVFSFDWGLACAGSMLRGTRPDIHNPRAGSDIPAGERSGYWGSASRRVRVAAEWAPRRPKRSASSRRASAPLLQNRGFPALVRG